MGKYADGRYTPPCRETSTPKLSFFHKLHLPYFGNDMSKSEQSRLAAEAFTLVDKAFRGNKRDVFSWFETANPNLSGDVPLNLIKSGKIRKLLKFLQSSAFSSSLK